MYFVKSFAVLAAAAVLASATPGVDRRAESGLIEYVSLDDNCGYLLRDCFQNDCAPEFHTPSDTIGMCSWGTYNGCPCEKCGNGFGYVGGCTDNGCEGYRGTCTAGKFHGCDCV